MNKVAGLILAAGSGSRFGEPKAQVNFRGEKLVNRTVRLLHESGCSEVFVVLGAWHGEVPNAHIVDNPNWSQGMSTSLIAGLLGLQEFNEIHDNCISASLITLVDLPGLTAEAYAAVGQAAGEIAIATFAGERGHPMKFGATHWRQIMESAHGDIGARNFLKDRADINLIEVGHLASGGDLDTREDFINF